MWEVIIDVKIICPCPNFHAGSVFCLISWSPSHLEFYLQVTWPFSIFTQSDFEAKSPWGGLSKWVMSVACSVLNHYMNQCWRTIIWTLGIKRQCNVKWNPTILIHVMTWQLSPTRGSSFIRPAVCHVHSDLMSCLPSRERKLPPFKNRRILLSIRQKQVVTWLNFTVCHRCQGSEPIDREKHQCNSAAGKLKSDISSHWLSKRLQSIIRHNIYFPPYR